MRLALSNAGFMYVKNHGIPQDLIDSVFHVSREFFYLPLSQKTLLHIKNSDLAFRGYTEPFGENTDPGKTKDLKECFDFGPERSVFEGPFFGPNQWPSNWPEFRELTYGYHQRMVDLAKKLRNCAQPGPVGNLFRECGTRSAFSACSTTRRRAAMLART
ncbi:2-oxoglutarate and iron-dependent oxygenase domain-containing protein [Mesorhizobium sp. M1182]|uniref:2-oxoglutarate and iron-dependent oxygenase domain-containing protein n=1 Tax=Mesorhizobium sp. M1182 TaxID=2957067 RepID=UPI00333E16F5